MLVVLASMSGDVLGRLADDDRLRSTELDHGVICPVWSENPGNLIEIDVVGNVIDTDAP
jgi:hypothetical protein